MGFLANYVRNLASLAAFGQPTRPLLFSYYVTHRCALACRYCSDGQGRPFKEDVVEELPTDQAKALITLLRADGDTLDITGGEPMLRPDLEDLLAHAKRIGFRTVLNTKGVGLSHRPDVMRLSDVFVLSVDSLNVERLAEIIGGRDAGETPASRECDSTAEAEDILTALDWILANRGYHPTRIVLSVVATPDNLDDVSDVLALCVRHRLGFQLSPQIVGTAVHPDLRDNPRFRSLVNDVIAAKSAGAAVVGVFDYLRSIRDARPYRCHPLLMPTIRPDGTVNLPCLEQPTHRPDVVAAGGYRRALSQAGQAAKPPRDCRGKCHIFCHMALSLLQRRPLAALRELTGWRNHA
ncbi:MAG: radical SAM protein [Phycisphaerae bacterium]|nr:radical SAM protein [Phycisphaerae bacterium]